MTFFDDFLWRALLAGLGVALIPGPLGSFGVWGRVAFFGDTLAHSALFRVALGLIVGVGQTPAIVLVAALVAVLLVTLQGNGRVASDTLLSIVAHGFLAAGLVALSFLRTVRVDLLGYLFGDILSVTSQDVRVIWVAALFGLAAMSAIWRPLLSVTVHADLARVEGVPVRAVRLVFLLVIALTVALAAKEAYDFLGSPEGELAIAEAVIYLATAPKSNRVYEAWSRAMQAAEEHPAEPVPLHVRNAPTPGSWNMSITMNGIGITPSWTPSAITTCSPTSANI